MNTHAHTPDYSEGMRKLDSGSRHAPTALFVGPLPPPLTGMSAVNAQMIGLIGRHTAISVKNTVPTSRRRSFGYAVARGWLIASATVRALTHRLQGGRILYASVDDGWGMIGNIACVSAARLGGLQIVLHHHSFKYILKKSLLMKMLVFVGGKSTRHIMLCRNMREKFTDIYGKTLQITVIPNVVDFDSDRFRSRKDNIVRMGFLSNITFEKGLSEFVRLHEEISREIDIEGILAGPIMSVAEQEFVSEKISGEGSTLKWIGPVYNQDKEDFFSSIDVFVFPTNYPTEAFPLVLIEALTRGIPVIAIARGCMCVLKEFDGTYMISPERNFHDWALGILRKIVTTDPAIRSDERAKISSTALDLNERWEQERNQTLIDLFSEEGGGGKL